MISASFKTGPEIFHSISLIPQQPTLDNYGSGWTALRSPFSVFFLKAYRKPRELTWVSGALLLFLMLGFGFSGYLLPWNTLAFFATQVGTQVAGALPGPG